jgi:anaerobic selenocysteine-containing dehydrogenase
MWIPPTTARGLAIASGDWVELTTFRPTSGVLGDRAFAAVAGEQPVGSARVRVFVTEGIHPRVVALSNSVGWQFGGRAAQGRQGRRDVVLTATAQGDVAAGMDVAPRFDDLEGCVWWDERRGGRGNGFNVNAILPINPAPLVGMQAWFDTVCSIKKVGGAA